MYNKSIFLGLLVALLMINAMTSFPVNNDGTSIDAETTTGGVDSARKFFSQGFGVVPTVPQHVSFLRNSSLRRLMRLSLNKVSVFFF